jgi:hypothetical protein
MGLKLAVCEGRRWIHLTLDSSDAGSGRVLESCENAMDNSNFMKSRGIYCPGEWP